MHLDLFEIAPAGDVGMAAALKGPQPVFLKHLVASSIYCNSFLSSDVPHSSSGWILFWFYLRMYASSQHQL